MPGLKLTLRQAATLFGMDAERVTRLLNGLAEEGFLTFDTDRMYRRSDAGVVRTRHRRPPVPDTQDCRHQLALQNSRHPVTDLLEDVGVQLPCAACHGSYPVSLRKIRQSQVMMDAGCAVRHFTDCPPAAFAHLIEAGMLAEFEAAVHRIETAAEGAGCGLVART